MQKIEGKHIDVLIPAEMVLRLDKVAARHNLTRSQAMRNMIDVGLSLYDDFESVGVVKLVEVVTRAKKAIRKEIGQQRLFETP